MNLLFLACAVQGQGEAQAEPSNANGQTTSAVGRYRIVGTGQTEFFDNATTIAKPQRGQPFWGQDAQFASNAPSYADHGDGTVTDRVTGLTWQKSYKVMTYEEALQAANTFALAGHKDWRLPTIKELYSLVLFDGVDASSRDMATVPPGAAPFLDKVFDFEYGSNGSRVIDTQLLSSTLYAGARRDGRPPLVFGLNVADGRIKGYPLTERDGSAKKFTVRLVRGNTEYGKNNFKDDRGGTVSDLATNLMWAQSDSGQGMTWQDALAWVEQKNHENYLGHSDWRLPNAKELQSLVDYSRSARTTNSAAIDPLFQSSQIVDEGGNKNYPFYWTSTTHKSPAFRGHLGGEEAVYICFGEGLGFAGPPAGGRSRPGFPGQPPFPPSSSRAEMPPNSPMGKIPLTDVHGAGAQRSDPKAGDPADYPQGRGPQGDVVRIFNYARLVRNI